MAHLLGRFRCFHLRRDFCQRVSDSRAGRALTSDRSSYRHRMFSPPQYPVLVPLLLHHQDPCCAVPHAPSDSGMYAMPSRICRALNQQSLTRASSRPSSLRRSGCQGRLRPSSPTCLCPDQVRCSLDERRPHYWRYSVNKWTKVSWPIVTRTGM